jgi:hypothetical protein
MDLTPAALASPSGKRVTLDRTVQVRFTQPQFDLLERLAKECDAKLSAVVRSVVVCWAANSVNEDADLRDADRPIDVYRLVDELRRLEALES